MVVWHTRGGSKSLFYAVPYTAIAKCARAFLAYRACNLERDLRGP